MINFNHIKASIESLEHSILTSKTTPDQARDAYKQFKKLSDRFATGETLTEAEKTVWMNLSLEAKRYLDDQELSRLRKTLRTPLMQATKRYVITDTDELVSPAGFHPDDKVFVATDVAIHTNTLAGVPVGPEMIVHEVNPA